MFIYYLVALTSVGMFVIAAEVLANLNPHLSREITRKIAHIGIACAVAVWPFYLDWLAIQLLGLIITIGVLVAIRFELTPSIHRIARKNYGEALFGIMVITAGMLSQSPAIFCATLLFLGLADGLAAVTGLIWGRSSVYRVMGETRSLVGTGTFFAAALMILVGYGLATGQAIPSFALIGIPLIATILENISIRGTDNISVPLFVLVTLNILI